MSSLDGRYRVEPAPERYRNLGTPWLVRGVPIVSTHERGGFDCTSAWLADAVAAANTAERGGYLPRLHSEHHDMGDPVAPAGFLSAQRLGLFEVEGITRPTIFADLLVTEEALGRLAAGELPYVSVEINDPATPAISSAALLATRAPYFKYPLITVSPPAVGVVDSQPRGGYCTAPLQWRSEMPPEMPPETKTSETKTLPEKNADPPAVAPESKPEAGALAELKQMLAEGLAAITQQIAALAGTSAAEKASPVTKPAEAEKRSEAPDLSAKLVALNGKVRAMELEREIASEVRRLCDEGYALDPAETTTAMYAAEKKGTTPGDYAALVRKHGYRSPDAPPPQHEKGIEAMPEGPEKWTKEYSANGAKARGVTLAGFLAMKEFRAKAADRERSRGRVLSIALALLAVLALTLALLLPPALAALTDDAPIGIEVGNQNTYGVSASCTVYAGSMVGMQATGYCRALVAGDRFVGHAKAKVVEGTAADGGANVNVYRGPYWSQVTFSSIAVTDVGKAVFATDDATYVIDPANGVSSRVGTLVRYVSSTAGVVEFDTAGHLAEGLVYALDAAGTAHTNSTDETALASFDIQANSLQVGDVIEVFGQAVASATTSTTTLTLKLYADTEELAASDATDVATSDLGFFHAFIVIRAVGSSGNLVASGTYVKTLAAEGTATALPFFTAQATEATNATFTVKMTADWSAADANSCRADVFNVFIHRAR
ncbi:MAG: hypothetical protein FD152_683 [Xanthobacteraceae bacterium]|nr:MAG: hypothetical protein FD152_683 [Xanthobacteraceae bacterium]